MSIIKHQDRTLGGGGGHKVLNSQGTAMTDRPNLQFLGMQVTDDNANGKTVVQGPSVPTALSAFTNDTNFIDNTVSNLTNYYAKTESYTKTEVNTLINSAKTGRFIVVSVLPTEDIDTSAIYLLPKSLTSSSNIKDEYINLNGTSTGWEKIGDTEIDLSNYVTTTAMNTALAGITSKLDKIQTDNLTFYVDATNGNDSNDGKTAATAFATVNKAFNMLYYNGSLTNESVIYIAPGTYSEVKSLDRYGRVYLRKMENTTGDIVFSNRFQIRRGSNVYIETSLILDNSSIPGIYCMEIWESSYVYMGSSHSLTLIGCNSTYPDQHAAGISIGGTSSFNVRGPVSISNIYRAIDLNGTSTVIISNSSVSISDCTYWVRTVSSDLKLAHSPNLTNVTYGPVTESGGRILIGPQKDYATKYSWVNKTLSAASWSNSSYSFEADYPSSTYDILDIEVRSTATNAQRTAWSKADCGGYYSTNVITAHGTVPSIDIPVALRVISK